jgi:hypothetical protein
MCSVTRRGLLVAGVGSKLKGSVIKVEMGAKSDRPAPSYGGGGRGGGYGGGRRY